MIQKHVSSASSLKENIFTKDYINIAPWVNIPPVALTVSVFHSIATSRKEHSRKGILSFSGKTYSCFHPSFVLDSQTGLEKSIRGKQEAGYDVTIVESRQRVKLSVTMRDSLKRIRGLGFWELYNWATFLDHKLIQNYILWCNNITTSHHDYKWWLILLCCGPRVWEAI